MPLDKAEEQELAELEELADLEELEVLEAQEVSEATEVKAPPKKLVPVADDFEIFDAVQKDPGLVNKLVSGIKGIAGAGEVGLSMATGFFAGAPAGIAAGVFDAVAKGDIQQYPKTFNEVSEKYTYEPKTRVGAEILGEVHNLFGKYSELVDKHLVDPNDGSPILQTYAKVAGEGLPLMLPFLRVGKPRAKSGAVVRSMTEHARQVEQASQILKVEDMQSPISGRKSKLKPKEDAPLPEPTSFIEDFRSNVNIAEAKMMDSFLGKMKLTQKVKDLLAIPHGGVGLALQQGPKGPGFLSPFQTTSFVARNLPALLPYVAWGRQAVRITDKGRQAMGNRLKKLEDILDGGDGNTPFVARVKRKLSGNSKYKESNAHLQEIAIQGDLIGREFTAKELRENFGANKHVVKGYEELRKFYKAGLAIMNRARKRAGKEPIEGLEGYVPHYFHQFRIIDVKAPTAEAGILATAKNLGDAIRQANEISRRTGKELMIKPKRWTETIGEGEEFNAIQLGDMDFFRLRNKLEKEFALNPKEAGAMLEQFAESFKLKRRSRTFSNQMERRGFKGYEQDLNYMNRHYANSLSRFVAMDQFKRKSISKYENQFKTSFDKEPPSETARFIKEYINDVNGNPAGLEAWFNQVIKDNKFLEGTLVKNFGDRPILSLANNITTFTAVAKLGLFNVASAAVNGMQLINANALLGPTWTSNGMASALRIAGSRFLDKGFGKHTKNRKVIEDMQVLRELGVEIQQGLEHGSGFSKFNQMGKIFRSSTALFSGVEWQLRAGTALGAFKKGIAEGMTRPEAIEFARETNFRVNFDYSIADAPRFIRRTGPLGQVLFQFKKFPINQMQFMSTLKGFENPMFWVPFVSMAGVYGMPGFDALKNMVKALTETDDKPGIDIELDTKPFLIDWAGSDPGKQKVVDFIYRGIGSAAGVDVSRRVGGADFIPDDLESAFAGPSVSSGLRAFRAAKQGEWMEVLGAIATAPYNIAIALQNDGILTSPWDRGRTSTILSPSQRMIKAFGFRTLQEGLESDFVRGSRHERGKFNAKRKRLQDEFLKAKDSGDNEKIQDIAIEMVRNGMALEGIATEAIKKILDRVDREYFLQSSMREKIQNKRARDFAKRKK